MRSKGSAAVGAFKPTRSHMLVKPSSGLTAPPSKPSFGNLGFFQCCGLPVRTSFQALIRESGLLPVLRAASPHLLPSPHSGIWASSSAAGPSFQETGSAAGCLPSPHSGILASSSAAGCQPALPSKPSFGNFGCGCHPASFQVLSLTSFQALIRESLASSSAAGCVPAPRILPFQALIRESWLLPVLRAASPPSLHSGILWLLPALAARPALFPILPVLQAATQHPPSKPSFGNLGFFQCCAAGCHPAPPSKPSFGNLIASSSAAGCHAAPSFQALIRESWLLPVLRCGLPSRTSFQALTFGNLSFFQCCRLPRSTLLPSPHSGILASSSAALRAAIPHLLPSPHSGISASPVLQAATQHPPSKPSFGNLGFFQCCAAGCHPAPPSKPSLGNLIASSSAAGCHAAPSFQALIRESWLLPVLRCGLPSRTSFQALIRESYSFFQCCSCHAAPSFQALIRESWLLPVLRCGLPSRTSFQALIRES